jgi:hypothetical protein
VIFTLDDAVTCALNFADVVVTSDTTGADTVTVPDGDGDGVGVGSGSSLPPPQAAKTTTISSRVLHLANIFFMLQMFYTL